MQNEFGQHAHVVQIDVDPRLFAVPHGWAFGILIDSAEFHWISMDVAEFDIFRYVCDHHRSTNRPRAVAVGEGTRQGPLRP